MTQLIDNIRDAEEVLAITLDKARNRLIYLNLFVSTGGLVVGSGAMVAGLFGMNLEVEATTNWMLTEGGKCSSPRLGLCGGRGLIVGQGSPRVVPGLH